MDQDTALLINPYPGLDNPFESQKEFKASSGNIMAGRSTSIEFHFIVYQISFD